MRVTAMNARPGRDGAHPIIVRTLSSATALVLLGAALAGPAAAQSPAAGGTASVPTSGMLGFEVLRLHDGERLGLAHGALLFDVGGGWGVGPSAYAGATGRRGGLFVGGLEVQRRFGLVPGLSLATGLFVGGGGGAGAPVGSGLMLRPALTLLKDLGPSLQVGLSLSAVRFPSGEIASNQLGLSLAWRNEFMYLEGANGTPAKALGRSSGLGFDRLSVTATQYRFTDGSGRRVDLVGAQAERRTDLDGFTWSLEAAAASKGGTAGYMEVLGAGEYSVAPLADLAPSWRLGLRAAAGFGGGGTVPTGGGLLGKVKATTEVRLAPGWTAGADYGLVRAFSGDMRAREIRAWLGIDLEPGLDGRSGPFGRVVRTDWVASLQHRFRVERRDGTRQSVDMLGLELNRYLTDHVYFSGQVHSAFSGGAGAYTMGLIGLGLATSADAPWRAGAEVLAGAAGGGGVQTAGGAIGQGMLWSAWRTAKAGEWRAGLGLGRPLSGHVAAKPSPVVELAWTHSFGMIGR